MRRFLVLTLVILLMFASVSEALAVTWLDRTKNSSLGQRGIASSPHVRNRHVTTEWYPVVMWDYDTGSSLAWEVAEWSAGDFDVLWHIFWENGTESWQWYTRSISQDAFHRLKTEFSSGTNWNLYLDDSLVATRSWKDSWNNYSTVDLEVNSYSPPYYYFMGRQYNIWLKLSDGRWVQQDSGWGGSISTQILNGSPFTSLTWNAYYWDWQARTP